MTDTTRALADILTRMETFVAEQSTNWTNYGTGKLEFVEITKSGKLMQEAIAALRAPNQQVEAVADSIIAQIEERFPNWKSYRDLVDCIDCTLHTLRGGG